MSLIPSRWRALTAGLAAAVGLGGAAAQAQSLAPQDAPKAWVEYAGLVTDTVSTWLSEDNEDAARLRVRLLGDDPQAAQAVTLELKVWIDGEGAVSKVIPVSSPETDAEVQAAVLKRRLPSPPPPKMLQPLRLAIEVSPKPAQ